MLAYPYMAKNDSLYTSSVTKTFGETSNDLRCALDIKEGFEYLKAYLIGKQTYDALTKNFKTCEPIASATDV